MERRRGHPDDGLPDLGLRRILRLQPEADGIASWPEAIGQRLADDDGGNAVGPIAVMVFELLSPARSWYVVAVVLEVPLAFVVAPSVTRRHR